MSWPTSPLVNVCEIIMGQAPAGSSYNEDGQGHALIAGAGDFGELTPEPKKYSTAASKISQVDDLILCIRATIGDLNWSDKEYCLGRGVAGLRPKKNLLDGNYLWHFIGANKYQLSSKGTGSTFKQVNRTHISEWEIPFPPLKEQKRIAAILDKADAIRRKRQQAIQLADEFLRSVFLDMFGDPVTNPKGWDKNTIEQLCTHVVDCPHSTPKWTESGVIGLRTSNLTKGGWCWNDERFVSEETYLERTKRAELFAGDIILSREGTVGIAAIVPENKRMCMGQRLVQLRVDSVVLTPEYLLFFLLYELEPERISRVMAGSTSKHLNVRDLKALGVMIPPLDEQARFSRMFKDVKVNVAKNTLALDGLDQLFCSLSQKAFSGQL